MTSAERPDLADLFERQSRARATGAIVVGARQGYLTMLFGEAVHAAVPDLGLRGLAAVERMANLAAGGASVQFQTDEPPGTGRSLREIPRAKVLERLRAGEGTPIVIPAAAESVTRGTPSPSAPASPRVTAADSGEDAADPAADEQSVTRGTPKAEMGAGAASKRGAAGPGKDVVGEGRGLLGRVMPRGTRAADVATTAPQAGASDTWTPGRVPPPLPGEAIVSALDVRKAKIANLVSGVALAQVYLESAAARGIALLAFGNVEDAVFEEPTGRLEGRAAYQAMQGAAVGTITLTTVDQGAAAVLPVVWRGDDQVSGAPATRVGLERIARRLIDDGSEAAILVRAGNDSGLQLISGGSVVVDTSTIGEGSAAAVADISGATLSVFVGEELSASAAVPQPPSAATEPTADHNGIEAESANAQPEEMAGTPADPEPSLRSTTDQEWEETMTTLCLYARSKLHRHSALVEEVIRSTDRSPEAMLATARQLRDMRPRTGNSREVMEDIAKQVDLVARAQSGWA